MAMQDQPRYHGPNDSRQANKRIHFLERKPPNLKRGGFLFKIPESAFRKLNITIDNRKETL